jgi:hypothetical protein
MPTEELNSDTAKFYAEALLTIGHPFHTNAVRATAEDLKRWCKGCEMPDHTYLSAEGQAAKLVQTARETWVDGWPKDGGTAKLYALFRQIFTPAPKADNQFIDWNNEPCVCGSGRKFRDCCKLKPAAEVDALRVEGERKDRERAAARQKSERVQ